LHEAEWNVRTLLGNREGDIDALLGHRIDESHVTTITSQAIALGPKHRRNDAGTNPEPLAEPSRSKLRVSNIGAKRKASAGAGPTPAADFKFQPVQIGDRRYAAADERLGDLNHLPILNHDQTR